MNFIRNVIDYDELSAVQLIFYFSVTFYIILKIKTIDNKITENIDIDKK